MATKLKNIVDGIAEAIIEYCNKHRPDAQISFDILDSKHDDIVATLTLAINDERMSATGRKAHLEFLLGHYTVLHAGLSAYKYTNHEAWKGFCQHLTAFILTLRTLREKEVTAAIKHDGSTVPLSAFTKSTSLYYGALGDIGSFIDQTIHQLYFETETKLQSLSDKKLEKIYTASVTTYITQHRDHLRDIAEAKAKKVAHTTVDRPVSVATEKSSLQIAVQTVEAFRGEVQTLSESLTTQVATLQKSIEEVSLRCAALEAKAKAEATVTEVGAEVPTQLGTDVEVLKKTINTLKHQLSNLSEKSTTMEASIRSIELDLRSRALVGAMFPFWQPKAPGLPLNKTEAAKKAVPEPVTAQGLSST